MTTEREVRRAFWADHPQFRYYRGREQNAYPVDVRVAFCDWVDYMQRAGLISAKLAAEVTL